MLLNLKWTRKNRNYRNGFNLDIETKKRRKKIVTSEIDIRINKNKNDSVFLTIKNLTSDFNTIIMKVKLRFYARCETFFHSIGINKCEWVWKILSIRCRFDWIIGIANGNWLYKRASIISSICDGSFCGEKQWH